MAGGCHLTCHCQGHLEWLAKAHSWHERFVQTTYLIPVASELEMVLCYWKAIKNSRPLVAVLIQLIQTEARHTESDQSTLSART